MCRFMSKSTATKGEVAFPEAVDRSLLSVAVGKLSFCLQAAPHATLVRGPLVE